MCHINKLRLGIVANVKVAEEVVLSDEVSQFVPVFLKRYLIEVEANTDCSMEDEEHLYDFLFFVIDYIFIFLVLELTRLEPKCDIIEELTICVLLGVKKESKVVENVIKQVMDNDDSLH